MLKNFFFSIISIVSPEIKLREERWRELVADSQKGDKESYNTLLKEIYPYIINKTLRSLKDRNHAEDCSQNCMVAVHKALHTYDPSKPFTPWLSVLVKNKIRDYVRKLTRSREVLSETELYLKDRGYTTDMNNSIDCQTLLQKLSKEYREILTLHLVEGYTYKDIAKKLNLSESLLRVRAFRAKNELHSLVTNDA